MTLVALLSACALSLLCGLVLSIPLPIDHSTASLVLSAVCTVLPVTQDCASVRAREDGLDFAPDQIITDILPLDQISLFLYPSDDPSQSPVSLVTETLTDTELVTDSPTTITVSAAPSTVSDIVTVFISTSPPPPSSTRTAPKPSGAKAAWAAPAQMTDLSAFNITAFPGGQQNLQLVDGIPASASASASASPSSLLDALPFPVLQPAPAPSPSAYTAWDNASTVLQLRYPADSANPAAKPQGGAEFYAAPQDIEKAQIVELCYSVFFPRDFDWVKGGKLPGLYAGRMACSGGDAALDCFSTRLMWRPKGAGELYLYAPKDKQTAALCADPRSVCDAAYGFSVGRGSFFWRAGGWTTVCQTVRLNTPGKQDGGFELYVNGVLTINRTDIFYRDIPPANAPAKPPPPKSTSTTLADGVGGILDPLVGILDRRTAVPRDARPFLLPMPTGAGGLILATDAREWVVQLAPAPANAGASAVTTTASGGDIATTATRTVSTTVIVYPTLVPGSEQAAPRTTPVDMIGIFFSTFFGGHGATYVTPREQFVWFKDFALVFVS
ncbi:hypothetical protein DFH07DRAFT_1033562 [Mycena maculata]|uniref:Polysaccharide lyase 14 domain-containing protein n=1 Tax=Mycena maculata TaxID=230809 RepID=A0AAD7NX97_9AGAR|nr:hypothetical protein DFH07DRAFT_1033562 [Mycena maculata]